MICKKMVRDWILSIIEADNPKPDIVAFNFGIFETQNGFSMYLTGAKKYMKDNDDWACRQDYQASNKYLNFSHDDLGFKGWEKMLDFSMDVLRKTLDIEKVKNSFLGKAQVITTGFDDGDLKQII